MISVVGLNYSITIPDTGQEPPPKPDIHIEIPVQVTYKYLDYDGERKYWRRNLKFTLFPFMFCFIPTYLFFVTPKHHEYLKQLQSYSILKWLRFLFKSSIRSPVLAFFNVAFLIFAGYANVNFLLSLYNIVNALLIVGEFKAGVFLAIMTSLRTILLLIGVDGAWIYGHRFCYLLTTLGSIRTPEPIPHKLMPCVRFRLGALYAILIFIHAYHAYMFATERVKGQEFESWHAWTWISYLHEALLASLCLPLYCNVAWNLCRHCTLLRAYLRSCTAPADQVITDFKQCFKELSTCFQWTTYYFSVYFSWAILVHLFSIVDEVSDFTLLVGNHGGATSFFNAEPAVVRGFVTFLILLVLKIGLIIFVVNTATQANTEAHYLRVALNDFMGREAQKDMTTDTYQAFRVLKYYVESRLLGARASVLRIPVVTSLGNLSRANFNTMLVVFFQLMILLAFILQDNETRSSMWAGGLFGFKNNQTSS